MGRQLLLYAALALIFCINVIDGEPYFRQDYKYFESTKAYYKYHQSNVPWKTAKQTCEAEGTLLYYPENRDEVTAVKTLYRDNIAIWLGVSRQENGDYKSVDGRDVNDFYHKWDIGEPNYQFEAEECVQLMEGESGKMNDYHCHALISFVCKVTLQAVESGTIEITDNTDKVIKPLVGHRNFYRFHANGKTWEDAKKTCELDAGILFYPEDVIEAGTIVDYTNQTYWRDWIWVGASRSNEIAAGDNQLITVDGHPLAEKYLSWSPREPNRRDNCVTLCRDGTYRSHSCNDYKPFMCKTSVFVTAIKPEKGLMHQPTVGVVDSSVPAQNPYDMIQSLLHNHTLPSCHEGEDCKTTCGIVDKESKSHIYFGNVIAEELQDFPVNKKLDAMYEIMRIVEEKWTEAKTECTKVTSPGSTIYH